MARVETVKSTKLAGIYLDGRKNVTFFRLDQEWVHWPRN